MGYGYGQLLLTEVAFDLEGHESVVPGPGLVSAALEDHVALHEVRPRRRCNDANLCLGSFGPLNRKIFNRG